MPSKVPQGFLGIHINQKALSLQMAPRVIASCPRPLRSVSPGVGPSAYSDVVIHRGQVTSGTAPQRRSDSKLWGYLVDWGRQNDLTGAGGGYEEGDYSEEGEEGDHRDVEGGSAVPGGRDGGRRAAQGRRRDPQDAPDDPGPCPRALRRHKLRGPGRGAAGQAEVSGAVRHGDGRTRVRGPAGRGR